MLESHRHRPGDLDAWRERSALDRARAATSGHRQKVDEAEWRIAAATGAHYYCAVSWGKDSVVAADMVARLRPEWPLVWIRVEPIHNPDCERVRDAFLALHPDCAYDEIEVRCRIDQDGLAHATGTLERGIALADSRHGAAVVGLRAAESAARRRLMRQCGWGAERTLWPIIDWPGDDVFAYLESNSLPVHPVYAMSFGGAWERERLRVSSIGGGRGVGTGRLGWETAYYPDRLRLNA